MTRLYECNFVNDSDSDVIESYECTSEYCLYCRNSQCCLILQRRPPRHLWEAWYFWFGVALLAVFLISSVSSYIVSNHRRNIQGTIPIGQNSQNVDDNRRNDREINQPRNNQDNQISISVISSTFLPQRKMLIIDAQPSIMHMSKGNQVFLILHSPPVYIMYTCTRISLRKIVQD